MGDPPHWTETHQKEHGTTDGDPPPRRNMGPGSQTESDIIQRPPCPRGGGCLPQCMLGYCLPPKKEAPPSRPPPRRNQDLCTEFLTHTSENITLPQTSFAIGNKGRTQKNFNKCQPTVTGKPVLNGQHGFMEINTVFIVDPHSHAPVPHLLITCLVL